MSAYARDGVDGHSCIRVEAYLEAVAERDASRAEVAHLLKGTRCPQCSAKEWNAASAARDELAALRERVEAVLGRCEEYPDDQSCITAGPEVFNAEACAPCRVRAALTAGGDHE